MMKKFSRCAAKLSLSPTAIQFPMCHKYRLHYSVHDIDRSSSQILQHHSQSRQYSISFSALFQHKLTIMITNRICSPLARFNTQVKHMNHDDKIENEKNFRRAAVVTSTTGITPTCMKNRNINIHEIPHKDRKSPRAFDPRNTNIYATLHTERKIMGAFVSTAIHHSVKDDHEKDHVHGWNQSIGNFEHPHIVKSLFDTRFFGCSGKPYRDSHRVFWLEVKRNQKAVCPICNQYYELLKVQMDGRKA